MLPNLSLSARRAWIETEDKHFRRALPGSLSARRAWIETEVDRFMDAQVLVALRKEGVD